MADIMKILNPLFSAVAVNIDVKYIVATLILFERQFLQHFFCTLNVKLIFIWVWKRENDLQF